MENIEKISMYLNEAKEHKITLILTDGFYKNLQKQVKFKLHTGQIDIRIDDFDFLGAAVEHGIKNNMKTITLRSSKERQEKDK